MHRFNIFIPWYRYFMLILEMKELNVRGHRVISLQDGSRAGA